MLQYIFGRTESIDVLHKDAECFFAPTLLLLCQDNQLLKAKSLGIFNQFINALKRSSTSQSNFDSSYRKSIESFIKSYWSQLELNKLFISLTLIAKQKPDLFNLSIQELIIERVNESQSKFRYNTELKNTLFTLFEYIDGDNGKLYVNKSLSFLSSSS